jgi:hypothetical protein
MVKWAEASRNEDTSMLKKEATNWMLLDLDGDRWPGRIPTSKADRGFNNPVTARHLTLVKKLREFDANPE